jgi:hypothetical protein
MEEGEAARLGQHMEKPRDGMELPVREQFLFWG